jgi:glycosyltransferase involved in cell wall biosynthesis
MRIVIDLQGAQCESRHRGIGRYSLALAQAMVRNRGNHEVFIVLSGLFPDTIEPIRAAFEGLLTSKNIRVWDAAGPVHAFDTSNIWRRHVAELMREEFLMSLKPDIIHISSLMEGFGDNAVHSIGLIPSTIPCAVTFYDVIPLIQSDVYLKPNPHFETLYREKLEYLKRANLFLAISESSRQEAIDHLRASPDQAVNIAAASDEHFRPVKISESKKKALLKRFGINRPFLMYSGATDERKNHLRLIKAFSNLPVDLAGKYQLAIVGGMPSPHQEKFEQYAQFCGLTSKEVVITGRVSDEEMVQLYNLTELFVFPSWHEGFGLPALEAMSCGASVIGANTTSIPEVIGLNNALFDPFDEKSISAKITEFLRNDTLRANLAAHGLKQSKKFSWDESAKKVLVAFESLHAKQFQKSTSRSLVPIDRLAETWLIQKIAKLGCPPTDESDWLKVSHCMASNRPLRTEKQLLLDISELALRDGRSGIQRVVRSVLAELLSNPPDGFRVEPVYATENVEGYRYARQFTRRFTGHSGLQLMDDPVEVSNGDIFLGLDLQPIIVSQQQAFYAKSKQVGAQVYFVIYDLLPVLLPQLFPNGSSGTHAQWLGVVAQSDGALCISSAVADEMNDWLGVFGPTRSRPFKLGWFHLGADVSGSIPTKGLPANSEYVLRALSRRSTFLSVGTIEPRKGLMQTVAAFERLWDQGNDVNLVLVGKQGWNVDLLVEMIRTHSELNRRLFWLEAISDEYLEKVYASSTCLIAASEGEGFGLPLIESAQYKLPIIARDLPVFREVADKHAFYFSGLRSESLAVAIGKWLALDKAGKTPRSSTMPWLTWKQSTQKMLGVILGNQWYQQWMPDDIHRFWGGDSRLGTQVGKRAGRDMECSGEAGYLIFGPYIALAAGRYQVVIQGTLGKNGAAGAHMDVAADVGLRVLGASAFGQPAAGDCLISLPIFLDAPCTDLEVRVWVGEDSDLSVSMIEITPLREDQDGQELVESKIIAKQVSEISDSVLASAELHSVVTASLKDLPASARLLAVPVLPVASAQPVKNPAQKKTLTH